MHLGKRKKPNVDWVTIPLGLYFWHRLGSVKIFLDNPSNVDARKAYTAFLVLVILLTLEVTFSPK
jgi:hypothetical protein